MDAILGPNEDQFIPVHNISLVSKTESKGKLKLMIQQISGTGVSFDAENQEELDFMFSRVMDLYDIVKLKKDTIHSDLVAC